MKQWEYNAVIVSKKRGASAMEQDFDEQGAEGWELVNVIDAGEDAVYIFKRPLRDTLEAR